MALEKFNQEVKLSIKKSNFPHIINSECIRQFNYLNTFGGIWFGRTFVWWKSWRHFTAWRVSDLIDVSRWKRALRGKFWWKLRVFINKRGYCFWLTWNKKVTLLLFSNPAIQNWCVQKISNDSNSIPGPMIFKIGSAKHVLGVNQGIL